MTIEVDKLYLTFSGKVVRIEHKATFESLGKLAEAKDVDVFLGSNEFIYRADGCRVRENNLHSPSSTSIDDDDLVYQIKELD